MSNVSCEFSAKIHLATLRGVDEHSGHRVTTYESTTLLYRVLSGIASSYHDFARNLAVCFLTTRI